MEYFLLVIISNSDWQLSAQKVLPHPVFLALSETPNDNLPVFEDEFDSLNMIN